MEISQCRKIGIALGGGGYRAAAFGLGVLLFLADNGLLATIRAVTSVSGGSITNAYAAAYLCEPDDIPEGNDAWSRCRPLLRSIAHSNMLGPLRVVPFVFAPPTFVAALAFFGTVACGMPRDIAGPIVGVLWLLGVVATSRGVYLAFGLLAQGAIEQLFREGVATRGSQVEQQQKRRRLLDVAYVARFYWYLGTLQTEKLLRFLATGPGSRKMEDLTSTYCPIFCATDLAIGSHLFLSSQFTVARAPVPRAEVQADELSSSGVSASAAEIVTDKASVFGELDDRAVCGNAPSLPVSLAVLASAAFPGVFQPVMLRSKELGLPVHQGLMPEIVRLADGGLFDNLGFSFFDAWRTRDLPPSALRELKELPDTFIAVNCGLPHSAIERPARRLRTLRLAASSFKRSMVITHQANQAARQDPVRRFLAGPPARGIVVSIGDNPFTILEEAERTEAVSEAIGQLETLGCSEGGVNSSWWCAVAQEHSPSVPTNLHRLGVDTVAQLVLHGYAAAFAHCAATLQWRDLRPLRTLSEVREYCVKDRS